jgi:signal transduction histidine kinase
MAQSPFALTCPNCATSLDINDQFCPGCGLGLDTLTLLLDSASTPVTHSAKDDLTSTKAPRLGEFLIQRNFITQAQLDEALQRQRDETAQGRTPKMLGELLVETGAMTSAAMQTAISDQIVSMQSLLRENNRLLTQRVAERTAELERVLARMKEVSQLKVNFLSNVSHELRTPLTQIQGYVAMFHDGMLGDLNPKQTDAIDHTMKAVVQLRTWIDELIHYTMTAKGELSISPARFSMSELAQSVIKRSVRKADVVGITLVVDAGQAVWVQGDMEKLSWVLLQLVDNGIKFTPSGGRVGIRVRSDSARRKAVIEVADTGMGIEAQRIPAMFDPVRPAADAAGFTGRGMGLGLVKRILAAHETEAKVESQVGVGSTFVFELPLAVE